MAYGVKLPSFYQNYIKKRTFAEASRFLCQLADELSSLPEWWDEEWERLCMDRSLSFRRQLVALLVDQEFFNEGTDMSLFEEAGVINMLEEADFVNFQIVLRFVSSCEELKDLLGDYKVRIGILSSKDFSQDARLSTVRSLREFKEFCLALRSDP